MPKAVQEEKRDGENRQNNRLIVVGNVHKNFVDPEHSYFYRRRTLQRKYLPDALISYSVHGQIPCLRVPRVVPGLVHGWQSMQRWEYPYRNGAIHYDGPKSIISRSQLQATWGVDSEQRSAQINTHQGPEETFTSSKFQSCFGGL